ncbi:reverse transcriptase domain-containing protein, partial [Salmonella sp. s55004]|uniref:reverse transcriptase domain-containing protein n=1 Tax=Salmonella sp. s55004 TaxID=3159675 RepID=UPI00397EB948
VSSWISVTSGVHQCYVLGPLLCVAYINALDETVSSSSIKKFADDTKVYKEICSEFDATNFQTELDSIFNWSKEWGMFFNVDKCKVMHVGSVNRKNVYSINGRNLEIVQKEKDLDVYLDSSLKSSKQCVESAKRANWILGLIRRHFKFLHKDVVLRLYKQTVRPILSMLCKRGISF